MTRRPRRWPCQSAYRDEPPAAQRLAAVGGVAAGAPSLQPAASWEPRPELPARAYSEDLPASLIRVEPEYPSLAREARVDGRVVAQVLVGVDGLVQDVLMDPRHSIPMLDDAAIAAERQWVFTPARVCGRPVAIWVSLPFDFRMP